jgi:UDP-2,3-diacylglucosamine pyrophosphatase LpxH
MEVKKMGRNVHNIYLTGKSVEVAILSDVHWDNPHCDRKLLKKHLDYCKEHNIPVVIIGDLFCLMQGRGDNRRNKSDILPEHNNAFYLDSIVDTAVEWFTPYADILTVIGYGNHETGIIKYQETDVLKRFVDMMNLKNNTNIHTGGYGGWIVYHLTYRGTSRSVFKHKYFHGSGGGGIVTKGALNLTRALETYENMELFTMGHIHENSSRNDVRECLEYYNGVFKIRQKTIHHCITGTYKEEYDDGASGWHVERGAPPKPLGGRIVTLSVKDFNDSKKGLRMIEKKVDSRSFPI